MFITDNLRVVRAKWRYLRASRAAAASGSTGTTDPMDNGVDLAQHMLQHLSWCEFGLLLLIAITACCLPLQWLLLWLGMTVPAALYLSIKDAKLFAPFLPKLDVKINPNPVSIPNIPHHKPDLQYCQALAAWPEPMRAALMAALAAQHLEQAQELCTAYIAYHGAEAQPSTAFGSSQAAHLGDSTAAYPVQGMPSADTQAHATTTEGSEQLATAVTVLPREVKQAYACEQALRAQQLKLMGHNVGTVPADYGGTPSARPWRRPYRSLRAPAAL